MTEIVTIPDGEAVPGNGAYAALNQHLHGDGDVPHTIRIKPMEWSAGPGGTLYASDGLGGEWTILRSHFRSTAFRRCGTATAESIGADIATEEMKKLVQSLRDSRIHALIDTSPKETPDDR